MKNKIFCTIFLSLILIGVSSFSFSSQERSFIDELEDDEDISNDQQNIEETSINYGYGIKTVAGFLPALYGEVGSEGKKIAIRYSLAYGLVALRSDF